MKDFKIIEIMELFDEGEITTADKIDRPQKALDREMFDDFNKRNPMAGGGMLVQPGFGGTRQGYKTAKRIEPNIGKTDLGKYEVKYKNKQIGTFDKISEARKALSIAKENDPPIPRKDVKLRGQVSFRSIVEQVMDDLLEEGYDTFSTADINSKLSKKIKDQYGVTNKTILKAIKTNRKLDKFKDFNFVKGTGLNQVKPLTKNKQKILIESFPEIDFDFTTGRKYGIDKTSDPVRWKKIKDFIEMPSEGLFPYGVTPKDGLWNSLYRSTISGDRWQLISKVPKNWRKGGAWKKSKFKDTLTGQTITYDNLEKYVDSQGGKGTYKNSLKSWENRKALTDAKIIFKGKEQSLGGVLNQQAIAKFGKEIPSGAKNVPFFGAFQIAHKQGVGNNFWDVEVAYRDANLKLNSLNKQLLSELKGVDNLNQRKKIIKNYSKQIKALPGGASFMFEGQELGKPPTLRSATEAAFKELGLSRTLEANKKQINNLLASFSANPQCRVSFGKGNKDGGRIGYATGPASLAKCADSGSKRLEKVIKTGVKLGPQEGALATQILKAGRSLGSAFTLSGLFGPAALAFTAAAEAGIVGYDMLTTGKTFKETIGDSLLNYALGEKTKIDPNKELLKRFGKKDNQGNFLIKGMTEDKLFNISKVLDQTNTLNTILKQNLKVGNLKDQVKAFREQPRNQFMMDEDEMLQTDQAIRAEQALKDEQKNLENLLTDYRTPLPVDTGDLGNLVGLSKEDAILSDMASGKFQDTKQDLDEAIKAAEIQKLESKGPVAFGKVFPKFEEGRQEDLLNLRAVDNPAVKYSQENQFMYPFGLAGGGIAKLAGIDEGPQTVSMNPDSQGLQSLKNRVKNI